MILCPRCLALGWKVEVLYAAAQTINLKHKPVRGLPAQPHKVPLSPSMLQPLGEPCEGPLSGPASRFSLTSMA